MSAAEVVPSFSPDDRGRVSQPDRALDRCFDLAQASLKCQTHWMVKWNHKRAGTAVQAQCKPEIEEWMQCNKRQTDKRQSR